MSFYSNPTTMMRRAALKIAGRGRPVFPCKRDKAPYYERNMLEHGCLDATTNPRQITDWWTKWPEANVGIPTGKASGLLVVDLDTYKHGAMTVEEFQEKYGTISHTATVKTGSGGMQFYFAYPIGEMVRNNAGVLGRHVDVRGEGGYVIAPPSITTNRYEWINRAPVAPVPPKLLEALRTEPHKASEPTGRGPGASAAASRTGQGASGPILAGTRNTTLTSIAGRLHDGTRDLEQLTGELVAVNEFQCVPPLEGEEVQRIARSIHQLAPCTPGAQKGPPEPMVVGLLGDILADWWRADWRGTGGKSNRDVLLAYILFALERGTILPNGAVLVDVSHHQVADRARKSSSTAYNAHKRLSVKGWCRGGGNGPDRRDDQPAGIVLLPRPHREQRKPEHPLPGGAPLGGVFDSASLPTARRGRHSAPGLVRVASASKIACIDYMERLGESSERAIADALGIARVYDVRKRYLEPLEACGVVERCGKRGWCLTEDWQGALERVFAEEEALERELYSGLTSDERHRKRREESRERWRNREDSHPNDAPSEEDMREYQESYPGRRRVAIESAMAKLFREHPEYRGLRAGQITCRLAFYLAPDFPRGPDGVPKDSEVEAILDGVAA